MSEPREITEQAVEAAVDAALAAIAAAGDSAALKAVRAEHTGEKSTLAQLNAELRNVPVDRKAKAARIAAYSTQIARLSPADGRLDEPATLPPEERYWVLRPSRTAS